MGYDKNPTEVTDCAGVASGTAVVDECGMCNGDRTSFYGCTDNTSCNYNALFTKDDGSCTHAETGHNCDGSTVDGYIDGVCGYDVEYLAGNGLCSLFPNDAEHVANIYCGLAGYSYAIEYDVFTNGQQFVVNWTG